MIVQMPPHMTAAKLNRKRASPMTGYDLINLFFLALAVVVFFRLRSVLGKPWRSFWTMKSIATLKPPSRSARLKAARLSKAMWA